MPAQAAEHEWGTMPINSAFLGHSMFVQWGIQDALKHHSQYGAPPGSPPPNDATRIQRFVQFLKDTEVATVWIQLFSRPDTLFDSDQAGFARRERLLEKLAENQIRWVGWGYCAGHQCDRNKRWIDKLRDDLAMTAFIIDVEPGNEITNPDGSVYHDIWDDKAFLDFVGHVNGLFGTDNTAITTWPLLQTWESNYRALTLMRSVSHLVGLFNPQVYWGDIPPVAYTLRCINAWRDQGFTQPLVVTGRSYWSTPAAESWANARLNEFVATFSDWNRLVGFGWYHAGQSPTARGGAMSDAMITAIKGGHLGGKPYRLPT